MARGGGSGSGASQLSDLSDVSGTYTEWDPHAPPSSPHADDHEFASQDLTEWDPGTILTAPTVSNGQLVLDSSGTGSSTIVWAGGYDTIPTATEEVEIMAALSFHVWEDSTLASVALAIMQDVAGAPTTSDLAVMQAGAGSDGTAEVAWSTYGDYTGTGGVHVRQDQGVETRELLACIQVQRTANNAAAWYSLDGGKSWSQMGTVALGYTPLHFGVLINPYSANIRARSNWVRITQTGASGIYNTMPGRPGRSVVKLLA